MLVSSYVGPSYKRPYSKSRNINIVVSTHMVGLFEAIVTGFHINLH
jgi:hypothetical protein